MTWLTPLYAAIAAAVAVPALVILYFLKLRRRDVEISTTLLWKKAIQDLQANAPFQRLRRNILLLLQLLVLGGIITALGQPQIKGQEITGTRHILLIDRSASMNALDEPDGKGGQVSRLEAAKKQALALVDSLREGGLLAKDRADEAMIVTFDTQADIRQQFTSDKALLRRAVEAIAPAQSPTSLAEAMRLAKAQAPKRVVEGQTVEGLTAGPPETIHIFTDGRIPDAVEAKPGPEDRVEFHRLGTPDAANLAITGVRAERGFDDPTRLSVFVSMQNNRPQPRAVDVELLVNDAGKGIKSTTLPPASGSGPTLSGAASARAEAGEADALRAGGAAPPTPASSDSATLTPGRGGVVFTLDLAEGAVVRVRLRDPSTDSPVSDDVLAIDDSAWLVVPPAKKLAVAVVSPSGNLFLSSALGGLPLSRLTPLSPAQFEEKSLDGGLGEYDVVVLDGWLPEGAKRVVAAPATPPAVPGQPPAAPPAGDDTGEEPGATLPPGRYLIMGEVPLWFGSDATGLKDLGVGGASSIVDWRRDHPVLRNAALDGLDIAKSRKVEVEAGSASTALAWSDAGPIIVDVASRDAHAIVVPFNVAESDWPFQVSFIVFLAQACGYLGDDSGTGASGRLIQPGQVLSDRLPIGAGSVTLKLPDGETQRLTPANDGRIVFGPVSASGVYEVSWEGPAGPTDARREGGAARYYAAGLLDSVESDLAAADRVELANDTVSARGEGARAADKKLWPWFLLAALGVVMLEWFIYNRKVHV